MEILPLRLLTPEDSNIFGSLNVALAKLHRANLPVGSGIVITPPNLKLKTVLESYDFGSKEVFEQSLTLVKKEISTLAIPEILVKETAKQKIYLLEGVVLKSVSVLWVSLLHSWIEEIKNRLWKDGFSKGIAEGLDPKLVIFVKKIESMGNAYFDPIGDDTVINVKGGKLDPNDLKKLDEVTREANKKLFIPHEYEWIKDWGVKLIAIKPYTNPVISTYPTSMGKMDHEFVPTSARSAVKVFFDLSTNFTIEKNIDGVYIASEKIFDLNKPTDSFENLVFRLVESSITHPNSKVLFKLADKSEGMGKVRGALRLLHQKSLFDPLAEAITFARHKKGLTNIHIVVPYVRGVSEFLKIKRELAVKKLMRKNSLELWMEVSVPENIINLEDYLVAGLDGVVLNLDELISHLNGFDPNLGEVTFYKNEISSLIKFIEDSLKLLHKSKIPFLACGSLTLYPQVLEFLVEKGVFGVVIEKYEAHSIRELLHQTEKRLILRRS